MKKLLNLLNEYAHTYADHYDDTWEEIEIIFTDHNDQCFSYECDWKYTTLVDDVVISKRYWFIQWLVENEKINFSKLNSIHLWKWLNVFTEVELYEDLIMLLSIQDNPIEFLTSILK